MKLANSRWLTLATSIVEMGTGVPDNQGGNKDNQNNNSDSQDSSSNKTTPDNQNNTNNDSQGKNNNQNDSDQQNNQNSNQGSSYADIFSLPVDPNKIVYFALTPDEVQSDPYAIPIYKAIYSKLPSDLTRLTINKV